jgi:hypothetical protein
VITQQRGWVLLEVMAAVALFAVAVGALTGGIIAVGGQAAALERRVETIRTPDSGVADAWSWGAPAVMVSWTPGPVLTVAVLCAPRPPDLLVGIWADGWQVAETVPDGEGRVTVQPSDWSDRTGEELIVRVRTAGAVWGAPWRSVIPPITGMSPLGSTTSDGVGGQAVAHSPGASSRQPDSIGTGVVVPGVSGFPFFISSVPAGTAGVRWEGPGQFWLSESYRTLDVFF